MHAKIGVEVMEKMEYKTVTINASGGAIKFSAEKFDSDLYQLRANLARSW